MTEGRENRPPSTLVDGGALRMYPRYTVGRVIPWWVARPQSPPPFHPAGGEYRERDQRARARRIKQSVWGPAHEDPTRE